MSPSATTEPGTLYLIATPIGCPEDIGLRALRMLSTVDCLAAEDTRVMARLLSHHGIKRDIISYHEHNAAARKHQLAKALEEGRDVGLASDAGTPLICDPGWGLVQLAIARQFPVEPVPGPSALIAALASSGLPCHEFCFSGFVPRKAGQRRALWEKALSREMTTVAYLSPHLLIKALTELGELMPERPMALHKEISKPHQRVWRDRPAAILEAIGRGGGLAKGEFVLIIAGTAAEGLA